MYVKVKIDGRAAPMGTRVALVTAEGAIAAAAELTDQGISLHPIQAPPHTFRLQLRTTQPYTSQQLSESTYSPLSLGPHRLLSQL